MVLLLGDGAAGFSLMDADTLVRHRLPVVMICGNNGAWGLEKHPMQALYGYDVAADLQPRCRYDEVVRALGGAGEIVARADGIGPALRRAFASGVPYLVNVITDPAIAYPAPPPASDPPGAATRRHPSRPAWARRLTRSRPVAGCPGEEGSPVNQDPLHRASAHHQVAVLARPGAPAPSPTPATPGPSPAAAPPAPSPLPPPAPRGR